MTYKKYSAIVGTLIIIISLLAAYARYTDGIANPNRGQRPQGQYQQKNTTNPVTISTTTTYTTTEVAKHNSITSCWSIVEGGVYDLTSWINSHPGGQQAVLGMCGIDGSSAFNDEHQGQARPAQELAQFQIGIIK